VRLPADATPVIYLTPIPRLVIGVSGQRYYVMPNMILVDVKTQDANAWLGARQARKPSAHELTMLDGHEARHG
jgi:hypothetical protein